MTAITAKLEQWTGLRIEGAWLVIATILALIALADPPQTLPTIEFTLKALASTAPYIIFAILTIAYLKASGAERMIARAFEGRETQMIVFAALFGGLAPFCSCEVIPFVAGLLALGTPLSAVMAFWLSSPLIDPPSLLITASALGWPFAIAKAVVAVSMGLMGGFAIKLAMAGGWFANPLQQDVPATSCCSSAPAPVTASGCCSGNEALSGEPGCGEPSPLMPGASGPVSCEPVAGEQVAGKPVWRFWNDAERRAVFADQAIENALFLFKWLTLAYLIESLMVTYIPADLIASVVGGNGFWPIVLSAIVGVPAYLNSYVAPPLVAGLMDQGMSAGGAMAFMVAGAVSCIPAMTAVFALVRRAVFAAYVVLGFGGAVFSGIVYGLLVNAAILP